MTEVFLICNIILLSKLITVIEHQSARRANLHALSTFLASEITKGFISKGSNHPLEAAVGKAKDTYAMLPAYPDTPSTENAFIRVIDEEGIALIHREFSEQLLETLWFKFNFKMASDLLKLAAAASDTVSTVYRV